MESKSIFRKGQKRLLFQWYLWIMMIHIWFVRLYAISLRNKKKNCTFFLDFNNSKTLCRLFMLQLMNRYGYFVSTIWWTRTMDDIYLFDYVFYWYDHPGWVADKLIKRNDFWLGLFFTIHSLNWYVAPPKQKSLRFMSLTVAQPA